MINLFHRSKDAQSTSNRMDGYTSDASLNAVLLFQSIIEREITDQASRLSALERKSFVASRYDALRESLLWARRNPERVNLLTLRASYNDALASDLGMTRR